VLRRIAKRNAGLYITAMLDVGSRVRGWTVTMPLEPSAGSMAGMTELLAEDAAGGCVVLRVPNDIDGIKRLRLEADLAHRHAHESLLQSVGVVEHNGWVVQVVEHVDGLTLDAINLVAGALPAAAVCHVGRQVALALVELHERSPVVFHGALAADRILVDDGGNVRLVDVGRARPQGSKRLISPERKSITGKPTAADDLWALGMILAESALGHPLENDGFLDVRVLAGALPDRLVDALAVLVGPADQRLRNASAAVRIFTDLEKLYGDGSKALRTALAHARLGTAFEVDDGGRGGPPHSGAPLGDLDDPAGPITIPEGITPFQGILKEAGQSDEHLQPNTIELPLEPRTVEMSRDSVLGLEELRRLAIAGMQPAPPPGSPPEVPLARASAAHAKHNLDAPGARGTPSGKSKRPPRTDTAPMGGDPAGPTISVLSGEGAAVISGEHALPPSEASLMEGGRGGPPHGPPHASGAVGTQAASDDLDVSERASLSTFGGKPVMIAAGAFVVVALLVLAFVLGMSMSH
jgi:serine/threonine protein kinase